LLAVDRQVAAKSLWLSWSRRQTVETVSTPKLKRQRKPKRDDSASNKRQHAT
jgi:hypothetical protein